MAESSTNQSLSCCCDDCLEESAIPTSKQSKRIQENKEKNPEITIITLDVANLELNVIFL